jgi:hypothetical protein
VAAFELVTVLRRSLESYETSARVGLDGGFVLFLAERERFPRCALLRADLTGSRKRCL